jgi:signal transduction histidine kinase
MIMPTNSFYRLAVTFFPDTRIKSISLGIEKFSGYSNDEMIGRSITQILADRTVFEMPNMLETAKNEGIWSGEISFRSNDKTIFHAYGTLIPLSDGTNKNTEFLLLSKFGEAVVQGDGSNSVYVDVSSRIRKYVHDLNNPLAVIMGSTQLLSLNPGCSGKIRSDIEKLYSELERIAEVVEKLHEYAFALCERISDADSVKDSIKNSA